MSLFDDIPGYRAALSAESEQRDAAFVVGSVAIPRRWPDRPFVRYLPRKPIIMEPLTLRRMMILDNVKSPFLCGGDREIRGGDIALFLWVCSPEFCVDKRKRDSFIKSCRRINAKHALVEIWRNVGAAFYDSPARSGSGESVAYWSIGASIVDTLANEYGWGEDAILDAPLARVLQYFKIVNHRRSAGAGERVPLFNPSDRVRAAWLESQNSQAEKEAAKHG